MKSSVLSLLVFIVSFCCVEGCHSEPTLLAGGRQGVTIYPGNADFSSRTNAWLIANPNVWGAAGKDGGIPFRNLKTGGEAEIYITAFDTDEAGLCDRDLILDIQYRDDLLQRQIGENRVEGRPVVQSRIDFSHPGEFVEAGHLDAAGDGAWKVASIFLERTPRQQLRAINGSFQFKIVMPKNRSGSLPIACIRLRPVEHREFVELREADRRKRGLKRIEYPAGTSSASALRKWKEKGFAVYPVNYLKPVFPNSGIDADRIGKELSCFEIPGRSEPVSFVIRSFRELRNVRIDVTDLRSGDAVIPKDRIDVRRVVFNDQRWGWGWAKSYGTCPDYLIEDAAPLDLPAETNRQFWLTIHVPDNQTGGKYVGTVTINSNDKEIFRMPLNVEVLPIKPASNRVSHLIFHSPFFRHYQKDPVAVLEDMKSHGLFPVFYPKGKFERKRSGQYGMVLDDFELELSAYRKVYPTVDKLFLGLQDFTTIWNRLNGPLPPFMSPFPEFESVYGRVLLAYAEKARKYGFEPYFTFVDEPGDDPDKRRMAYLCSYIARKNGLKTWADTYIDAERQLPLSAGEKRRNINYLRPLSEVLDVFVNAIRLMDDACLEQIVNKDAAIAYYTTYPGTSVSPVYNRFLNGIYPFVTNVEYVFNYAYRDGLVDPYDDMDCRSDYVKKEGMNDYLLTYPSWKGDILPTLSYETLREGVEDAELISLLQDLSERTIRKKHNRENNAQLYIAELKKKASKKFRGKYWAKHQDFPVDPMEKEILRDLNLNGGPSDDYEVFDKIRREICDKIIELQGR